MTTEITNDKKKDITRFHLITLIEISIFLLLISLFLYFQNYYLLVIVALYVIFLLLISSIKLLMKAIKMKKNK